MVLKETVSVFFFLSASFSLPTRFSFLHRHTYNLSLAPPSPYLLQSSSPPSTTTTTTISFCPTINQLTPLNMLLHKLNLLLSSNTSPRPSSSPTARSLLILLFLLLLALRYALYFAYWVASSYHYEPNLFEFQFITKTEHMTTEFEFAFDGHDMDQDTMFCDRSHHRTDVCQMKGDVRTHGPSRSIFLYGPESNSRNMHEEERIKPYTRKWESSIMGTVDEIALKRADNSSPEAVHRCDVIHSVPAVVFSTGGYTGNVYHEFNDGLIPLFITSQHLKGEVVFVVLEHHDWWVTKYNEIVKQLSHYPLIDFNQDTRTHCFPHVTVGLRIHDELTVDPKLMPEGESMRDFQSLLREAYLPRLQANTSPITKTAPKLVIVARKQPRELLNQEEIVKLAEKIGFQVEVLLPNQRTEMVDMYRALNTCDVMLGVHGAAMTHFVFMRPGSIFIQVVPLGTDWAAWTYYGEPAMKLGLDYKAYKISPEESTLSDRYAKGDMVLTDPDSINKKGWWETKKVYLDDQDVRLSPVFFKKTLMRAFKKSLKKLSS